MNDTLKHLDTASIITSVLNGTATVEEEALFRQWLEESEANRHLFGKMQDGSHVTRVYSRHASVDVEENIRKFTRRLAARRRSAWIKRTVMAAAVVALLFVGGYFLQNRAGTELPLISRVWEDAVLIMPDGSEIVLDKSTENSRIASRNNLNVHHTDGALIYETAGQPEELPEVVQYGRLIIPKGRIFDLKLEDGTRVWLNAGSELQFPSVFGSGERRVILSGEGYFEVAQDKRPFRVDYAGNEVTVLGTQFNISAYPDDGASVATLVEGSISLRGGNQDKQTILTPGQQAVKHTGSGIFEISDINTEDVAIWRNEIFQFDGRPFDEVFRKLSRWYDFEYSMDPQAGSLTFMGNLRVYDDINSIFRIIERLGQVGISNNSGTITIELKK